MNQSRIPSLLFVLAVWLAAAAAFGYELAGWTDTDLWAEPSRAYLAGMDGAERDAYRYGYLAGPFLGVWFVGALAMIPALVAGLIVRHHAEGTD